MQPEDPFDVPFCDLCNASVPLQDLEQGVAVRHQGKTIGACCLMSLRAAGGDAAVGAAFDGAAGIEPAALAPGGPAAGQVGGMAARGVHDSRFLPLAVALLAAIAAATIFLDYRMAGLHDLSEAADAAAAQGIEDQAARLNDISASLDGVVRRSQLDDLEGALRAQAALFGGLAEQLRGVDSQLTQSVADLQLKLRDAESRRPDYGPALNEIREQLRKQAISLAELMARPRPEATPVSVEPAAVAEIPGVPANLQHEITRLADEDPATRFQAVDELLRSKNVLVLEHVLPMLKDDDLFVRRLVVEGLREFRKPEVVDALLVALADPEDIVRDTAWRSLKEMTGQKLPFEAAATREVRARAQQRWQEWWSKNRDTFGV